MFSKPSLLLLTLILAFAGCSKEVNPELIKTSESALATARAAMDGKDYPEAMKNLDLALEGVLMPDLYCGALMARSECHARAGNFDQAMADLDRAERGAALDEVHALRSFILNKQGRSTEAQKELRDARAINPQVQAIEE